MDKDLLNAKHAGTLQFLCDKTPSVETLKKLEQTFGSIFSPCRCPDLYEIFLTLRVAKEQHDGDELSSLNESNNG